MINNEKEKQFLNDIKKNITNKEDMKYIEERFDKFMKKSLNEIEAELIDNKEKTANLEEKVEKMQKVIDNIEKDVYSDKGFDFEIICPYCDTDFIVDIENEDDDIICPNCEKTIELDWSGSLNEEDDMDFGCSGSCSTCSGCHDDSDEDM